MERGLYDGSIRLGIWAHCGRVRRVRARTLRGPTADIQDNVQGIPSRAASDLEATDRPFCTPRPASGRLDGAPSPKRGPSPTEIEAETLARTWPLLTSIFVPCPGPARAGNDQHGVPWRQLWPSPPAGSARRELTRYWSIVTPTARPALDPAVRLSTAGASRPCCRHRPKRWP